MKRTELFPFFILSQLKIILYVVLIVFLALYGGFQKSGVLPPFQQFLFYVLLPIVLLVFILSIILTLISKK